MFGEVPLIFPLDKSATCVPPPLTGPILWFFLGFAIKVGISFLGRPCPRRAPGVNHIICAELSSGYWKATSFVIGGFLYFLRFFLYFLRFFLCFRRFFVYFHRFFPYFRSFSYITGHWKATGRLPTCTCPV